MYTGEVAKIGVGKALQNKWIKKEGDLLVKSNTTTTTITDEIIPILSIINQGNDSESQSLLKEDDIKALKKRKLIIQINRKSYSISKGPEYQPIRVKRVAELTKDMLGSGGEVCICTKHYMHLLYAQMVSTSYNICIHYSLYFTYSLYYTILHTYTLNTRYRLQRER